MKIVLLGPAYPIRGGIAHHTTLLAEHLRRRHQVTFLSFRRAYPRLLFPGRTDRDPSTEPRLSQSERMLAPLYPWTWVTTGRRIRAERPDVVVIPWWSPFWAPSFAGVLRIAGARAERSPTIFICHNVWPHDGVNALHRALTRFALRRGDGFLTHSEADAEILRALRPGAPVEVSLLPSLALTPARDRAEARTALGISETAKVVLFLGFVRPYKGLEVLIESLPAAIAGVPDLQLVVAGEAWRRSGDVMAAAARLGVADHVRFDDRYIPNEAVGTYLGAADVMALPYLEATQSGVVTLAAAAGLPVVASRVGGLPESVRDGVTGLLVPAGDAAALAAALNRMFTEPGLLDRMRSEVAAEQDRFGWEVTVERLESLASRLHAGRLQSNER